MPDPDFSRTENLSMKRSISRLVRGVSLLGAALAWLWITSNGLAQEAKATAAPAAPASAFRKLAPDVMETIDPMKEAQETFAHHDVVELLAVDPNFEWAKDVVFRRDIWYLEFKFKPLRLIWVDIPQPDGNMKRKLIRYLVYSVTNTGKVLHPVQDADGTFKIEAVDKPIFFVPEFLLESHEYNKAYPDRVIPVALGAIRMREDPRRTFYSSVDMARDIAVGETVWGVAMWEDVDPRLDRFSIYVNGLTNAYKWKDDPGVYKTGDAIGKGRRLAKKTLKLNFWRPGDEYYEHEDEIRYGIPGEVDYEWVYR
jgi:hypothetical protein